MGLFARKFWLYLICSGMLVFSGCQWPPAFFGEPTATEAVISAATPLSVQVTEAVYPGSETIAEPAIASETPPPEEFLASPSPEGEDPLEPTIEQADESSSVYPGAESSEGYPAPGTLPTVTRYPTNTPGGSDSVYPGSDAQDTPPGQTPGVNTTPQTQATPSPSPTSAYMITTPITSQATDAPGPSMTPAASLSPVNTPTAFPTQTPIPPPPWMQSKLVATHPDHVVLASGKVQLIEFFAFWCGPSQAMAPLVHGLEDRYQTRMNFIYLDIDDPRVSKFKQQLGYKSQPHFFLLDPYGKVLAQWVGAVPIDELAQAIEAVLK
jgi:thiol-disulfide isomerase/thioredoxin